MVRLIALRFVLCAFSIFLSLAALAASAADPGAAYFNQGIEAANNEDYATAVQAFKNARLAGHETVVVDYNLGVVYFKMQEYTQAGQAFERLTQVPEMAELAFYNLGLVAARQRRDQLAIRQFQTAYALSVNDEIHNLSRIALERLGVDAEQALQELKRLTGWHGLLDLSASNDSNINLDNQDLNGVNIESDRIYELFVDANRFLFGEPGAGLQFDAQASVSEYETFSNNDFSAAQLALKQEFQSDTWAPVLGVFVQNHRLDRKPFQQVFGLDAETQFDLSPTNRMQMRYSYYEMTAASNTDAYLDGTRHEFRIRLYHGAKPKYWRLEYKAQIDNRTDYFQAGEFRSYSPARHTILVTRVYILSDHLSGRLDIQYRDSRFADDDVLMGIDPYQRVEQQYRLGLRFDYAIAKTWNIYADLRRTINSSNRLDAINETTGATTPPNYEESYSYQHNQLTTGVTWSF